MISIKKYLDQDANTVSGCPSLNSEGLLAAVLEAYRAALNAMGSCGVRACPTLGPPLQNSLMLLADELGKTLTLPLLRETERQVEEQLHNWGEQSAEYFRQRAGDVKEILMVLARAAESLTERDQRYAAQFGEFTKRLQGLANLEDLPRIRAALVRGARDLKTCVEQMEQDGRESVAALRSQVSTYQAKLEEAEQRASHDALTGLENRQAVESKLHRRLAAAQPFCVLLLDLNGFKSVNDAYGHLAGDDLLKQFGAELRSGSRSTDVVGRWGGDEFIVVIDGSIGEGQARVERMRKWVFGGYTIHTGAKEVKVQVDAALGLVEAQPGETLPDILARADALMYKHKAETRQSRASRLN